MRADGGERASRLSGKWKYSSFRELSRFCDMGRCMWRGRVAINHRNVVNMISQFATLLGDAGMNISDMTNKSKGDYAYTLIDLEAPAHKRIIRKLESIEGGLKVRVAEIRNLLQNLVFRL